MKSTVYQNLQGIGLPGLSTIQKKYLFVHRYLCHENEFCVNFTGLHFFCVYLEYEVFYSGTGSFAGRFGEATW